MFRLNFSLYIYYLIYIEGLIKYKVGILNLAIISLGVLYLSGLILMKIGPSLYL